MTSRTVLPEGTAIVNGKLEGRVAPCAGGQAVVFEYVTWYWTVTKTSLGRQEVHI